MNKAQAEFLITLTLSLFIGAYFGMFIAEARTIYECEKDKSVTIKSQFWKGEMKYSCQRNLEH